MDARAKTFQSAFSVIANIPRLHQNFFNHLGKSLYQSGLVNAVKRTAALHYRPGGAFFDCRKKQRQTRQI
ncbi:MAG: hypothetical protein CFE34_16250 [Rhodobacteraceae bacterium PARR1]|nr:MAG: hypothetical protein CFE34_16250 [Rhodobacteraceae bacterium PARR1]